MDEVLLIAGSNNPVVADYATHCLGRGCRNISVISTPDVYGKIKGRPEWHPADNLSKSTYLASHSPRRVRGVVVFLNKPLTDRDRAMLEAIVAIARESGTRCICIVSTFLVHFGDRDAARAEAFARRRLQGFPGRVVVLRPSHIVSRNSRLGVFLRRFWFGFPLFPGHLKGCCLEGAELFAAIDQELGGTASRKIQTYTLLGANRPWKALLLEGRTGTLTGAYVALMKYLWPLTVLRFIAGLFVDLIVKRLRPLQPWHVETLRPRSIHELLTLYNKYNYRHVKVVGYNNGVVHFGQHYPGKTVVSTVRCNQRARVRGPVAEFDTGVTIRQAMDVLRRTGQELPVLPNYSYVSLGTSFFIPIHGSASKFTTIGETIEKVVLYDPAQDRFLVAKRDDPAFGHYMYNLAAEVLLLRLRLQTKEKSRYYVKQLQMANPSSREILSYFHDNRPANVEVRKAGSAAQTVEVYQYYTEPPDGDGAALEVPRDAIGRLWDRLEENPLSSVLFHGLTRWLGYHVELFLPEAEFATFWETHGTMPILKIQLRFIRRDGFPNSPFRQHDCLSADLFMLKKHKARFDAYLKETLPTVQMNPGKHTR
jgi:hypothetical protein